MQYTVQKMGTEKVQLYKTKEVRDNRLRHSAIYSSILRPTCYTGHQPIVWCAPFQGRAGQEGSIVSPSRHHLPVGETIGGGDGSSGEGCSVRGRALASEVYLVAKVARAMRVLHHWQ